MTFQRYEDVGYGITRIESGMIRDGLAACYLVESGTDCVLVETGTHNTVPHILQLLAEKEIDLEQVKYVIPTHVHLDHAGGVGGLMKGLPQATLAIHPRGARHMVDPSKLKAGAIAVYGEEEFSRVYGDIIATDESRVQVMEDGDKLEFGGREFSFLDTPGHARHHFCVYDKQSSGIFTGDTFGLAYQSLVTDKGPFILPTTTPVQFEPEALKESVKRLLALGPERMFMTHYGVLENPEGPAEELLKQIDDYVAMAVEVKNSYSAEEQELKLIESLTEYTLDRARKHGCTQDEEELKQLLALDMRLNSQGILVWLEKESA